MKKLTYLTLTLAFTLCLSAFARADDTTICIKKAGDTTAKVGKLDGKDTVVVPISFDSGADWSAVKDSYDVSSDTAAALMAKKDTISVGSDGGVSFHTKTMSSKKK
jgi:peroxiredoxin